MFQSERGERMSRSAFWRVVSQADDRTGLAVHAYAHLLRHSCGYYLANKGCDLRLIQDYLGQMQIQNTVRYTALNPSIIRGAVVPESIGTGLKHAPWTRENAVALNIADALRP